MYSFNINVSEQTYDDVLASKYIYIQIKKLRKTNETKQLKKVQIKTTKNISICRLFPDAEFNEESE